MLERRNGTPRSRKTQGEIEDDVETPVQELRVTVHKTFGNRYGSTNISNNASAVLGDVTHHNYFYGGTVPYLAGLQAYQGAAVDPDTISNYDYRYAHWHRSEQRLEHTCEWIFERPVYNDWLNNIGPPILVVSGTVGSGKSITASAIIDKLSLQHRDPQLVVSYFVDHSREQPTTCIEILRALVKQLLHFPKASNENISQDLQASLKAVFPSTQARPSAKTVTRLVSECLVDVESCIFVIDGIDALPEREIDKFLDSLHELFPSTRSKDSRHKLIVFCRHSLGRGVRLESIPSSAHFEIRIRDIQRDLFTFVDHEVDLRQRRRPITDDTHVIEETKRVLKAHCGKMFLWIGLQILSLWDPGLINCDDDIRQQLSSLPGGLDEIYTRCLRRIEHTYDKSSREIAPKLFKWVACANEPLTQLQAREAVRLTPGNIPLRKSQMLNTPAEDHCANLVTLDVISGRIAFPHPSVRDFLRDPLKVPPDLHHYLLSAETDELWCGEICLAYVHYLQSRKQIVSYSTTRVQKSITTAFVKDVPGAWLPSLFLKPRYDQAFHMPSPRLVRGAGDLQESSLHDYMRRNWLSHNKRISQEAHNHITFATLCLSHDPQLQPWAAEVSMGRLTGLEHYQKAIEFAVMTNHAPLLHIIVEHLRHSKSDLLSQIFLANCPGTDSSWLHVCAALGHKEVMHIVLPHCSKATISHGRSAAVLALEHKNFDLFVSLLPNPPRGPVWNLTGGGGSDTCQENLLRACTTHGNGAAIDVLLAQVKDQSSRQHLSDAFLHACKYNTPKIINKVISAGANAYMLDLLVEDREYYMAQFSMEILVGPALVIAWHIGDLELWRTIWTVQTHANTNYRGIRGPNLDLVNLRKAKDLREGSVFRKYLDPFFDESIADYLVAEARRVDRSTSPIKGLAAGLLDTLTLSPAIPHLLLEFGPSLTWLEIIMDHVSKAPNRGLVHAWNSITRRILMTTDLSRMVRQTPSTESLVFTNKSSVTLHHPILHWLRLVPDDILIRVLKTDLVQLEHMLDPVLIRTLATRSSSRGLEAWLHSLRLERLLCCRLSGGTAPRVCLSAALEQFAEHAVRSCTPLKRQEYCELFSFLSAQAARESRIQVVEFFACYEFANTKEVTFGPERRNLQTMLLAWDISRDEILSSATSSNAGISSPSTLTWLKYSSIGVSNDVREDNIQKLLMEEGPDGNFALNYPAGYDSSSPTMGEPATGEPVQRVVIEAMHHWNFRLRRKRRASFSDAEIWYMALVLKRGAHRFTPVYYELEAIESPQSLRVMN